MYTFEVDSLECTGRPMYIAGYTVYSVQCTVYSTQCTVHCTVYCTHQGSRHNTGGHTYLPGDHELGKLDCAESLITALHSTVLYCAADFSLEMFVIAATT